jgi:uncharacterized protein (TIGR03067 family)
MLGFQMARWVTVSCLAVAATLTSSGSWSHTQPTKEQQRTTPKKDDGGHKDKEEPKAKSDCERIQGIWVVVSLESEGRAAPTNILEKLKVVFTGDKIITSSKTSKNKTAEGTFQLDSAAKPKAIDLTRKGKTI